VFNEIYVNLETKSVYGKSVGYFGSTASPENVMGKFNKNKNQRWSAKAKGLTTQCDKKIV
jgi:hypothetical protein